MSAGAAGVAEGSDGVRDVADHDGAGADHAVASGQAPY